MGIYDRDYYRKDGPSFLGTLGGRTVVCKWLIFINIGVFVLQLLSQHLFREGKNATLEQVHQLALQVKKGDAQQQQAAIDQLQDIASGARNRMVAEAAIQVLFENGQEILPREGLVTRWLWLDVDKVAHGQVWRLLTYAFLHGSLLHIIFNMLFLWWFGSDIEDIYGPREFLAIYLVAAVLAGLACEAAWLVDLTNAGAVLGASGAVMAVVVLCALHFPTRIIYLFLVIPVPIWLFVVFMVASDLLGFLGIEKGQTAFAAHLGGAAFGFLYFKWQGRLLDFWPGLPARSQQRRARPQLRIYHDEEEGEPVPVAAPAQDADEHLEAKVDAVLEKVAQFGQGSLTDSERQILLKASEVYKKRRS